MKKKWILILVISLFAGIFSSCKSKQKADKDIVIAVIPKVDNAIFDQVKEGANDAGKELDIAVTWEAPTTIDGAKQKELIENLIQYKVDGILISSNDAEALKNTIDKAISVGIKVATFDSDVPKSSRIFYIGTDNKKAGEVCAQTMLDLYEKLNKQPNQVVIVSGGMSANNMLERISGFRTIMNEKNIVGILNSFEIPEYGKEILTYTLNNNNKIDGVQFMWGIPVLNGVDSIPALTKLLDNGGVSVFFDVSKPLLKYIKHHSNCATIKQNFNAMGYDGVKNLYKAIKGEPYSDKILYDVIVIDQSNAEKELESL